MPKTVIRVNKTCIDVGIPCNANYCPIATAVKNQIRSDVRCVVDNDGITLIDVKYSFDWSNDLPLLAKKFVLDFDSQLPGSIYKPFRFTLDIPAKYLKRKAKKK